MLQLEKQQQQHKRTSRQSHRSASRCRPSSIDNLQIQFNSDVWGTSPILHWGQVAWSKAKDFTRKQFKRCCIRDLAFVVALTWATAALNFTFPAGHFLPLSCLSLHIVSFHILSPLKQSLLLHPSPVSTPLRSYGICIQRSHANLSPVFKLCVVGLRAKLLLSSTERNQLKQVRHLAMFCQNNTWEWLQITYYSYTLLEFLIVKVHTHTHTAEEVGTWGLQQKPKHNKRHHSHSS